MRSGESQIPPSLLHPDLAPVWSAVRHRLETAGPANRGRVKLPQLVGGSSLTLQSLLGKRPTATLDLGALEEALRRVGVSDSLLDSLARLGHPVSMSREIERERRRSAEQLRAAARSRAAEWVEPWATQWINEVISAGLLRKTSSVDDAVSLVDAVRRVLDALDAAIDEGRAPGSRVELAASVLGDAHALDRGSLLESATTKALRHRLATDHRAVWELTGVHGDLVSGAAIAWGLPEQSDRRLHALVAASHDLGAPLHLNQLMMRAAAVTVPSPMPVLIVENPRIVEAAAQRGVERCVVATNGNPSAAVSLLLVQLQRSGAVLHCHNDFDAAGLRMSSRLMRHGAIPWRMRTVDYERALAHADRGGVELPVDGEDAPATPWDESLRHRFDEERRIVHEERLIEELLSEPLP